MTTALALAEHSFVRCTHPSPQISHATTLISCRLHICCPCEILTMHPRPAFFRTLIRTSTPRVLRAPPAEYIPTPAKRLFHTPRTSPTARPSHLLSRNRIPCAIRCDSSLAAPSQARVPTNAPDSRLEREQVPSYELTFTCNVCKTRSSHRLSKQGYHKGTILISCPDCKNRHLISDHLKVGWTALSGLLF
jgi:protein import protein ZIM17